jgi:hypothetical protein
MIGLNWLSELRQSAPECRKADRQPIRNRVRAIGRPHHDFVISVRRRSVIQHASRLLGASCAMLSATSLPEQRALLIL